MLRPELEANSELHIRQQKAKEAVYSLKPPFPKEFLIDIASLCNHKCTFCSNPKMTDKKKANTKLVYNILEEARNEGSNSVGLFATGEPFLSKDLEGYIKFAKKIGYEYVFINTNGAAATAKRMKLSASLSQVY